MKGDIDRLISFVSNNVHNLNLQLDESEEPASKMKEKINQKKEYEEILTKL